MHTVLSSTLTTHRPAASPHFPPAAPPRRRISHHHATPPSKGHNGPSPHCISQDPVPSTGFRGMSISIASHGGQPVALRNDTLTAANPYTNHLRYCITSYELGRALCPDQPALRVRYLLPGLHYNPDENNTHIAPTPTLATVNGPQHPRRIAPDHDVRRDSPPRE